MQASVSNTLFKTYRQQFKEFLDKQKAAFIAAKFRLGIDNEDF